MSKIAVKPYLNVNVKPHIIKGEEYYPVYLLVRAKARNTKIRSHANQEIYTATEFEKLNIAEGSDEIKTVETLVRTQIEIDGGEFNTVLFGVLYRFLNKYPLKVKLPSELMLHLCSSLEAASPKLGLSFYDWFTPKYQKKIERLVTKRGISPRFALTNINAALLYSFFQILHDIIRSDPKKLIEISTRYEPMLRNARDFALRQLAPLPK